MPGVQVLTQVRSGPVASGDAPATTFFLAGLTERGPTGVPVKLSSMADYVRIFGSRVTYGTAYDQLQTFFEEGGLEAQLTRVVGPAKTIGLLNLLDRHATTPVATVRIDAYGPGAWSTGVTVAVADGTQADTVDITVTYGTEVETYLNLASPAAIVTALSKSDFVRAVNLGSATAAPLNNPAVLAATALSAGADDRASVVTQTYVDAVNLFGPELGAGAVAVPGQSAANVGSALIAHAKANRRIALLAPTVGSTVSTAITQGAAITSAATDEEHAGLFYPWVKIPDGVGGTHTISPEGFVAAARTRAHLESGAWRAPGGEISASRFVVEPEVALTRAEGDRLDANRVSAIRTIAETVRLYGWRTLSTDTENWSLLTGRDLLNYLAVEADKRLEKYVFRSIDSRGHLFGEIEAEMIGLVEPIRAAGGLYEGFDAEGNQLDPGYSVDTGPSVNTSTTLLANEAHVAVAVRISPTGALIYLSLTKASLTASV